MSDPEPVSDPTADPPPAPDSGEIQAMHRWFAVEGNNRAWDLAEQSERTEAEDDEMTLAAHAAAWHWAQVGTALHAARADLLRVEVFLLQGRFKEALPLAARGVAFFDAGKGSDWDRALALLQLAHARSLGGEGQDASGLLARAADLAGTLDPEEDAALLPYRKRVLAQIGAD